MKNGSMTRGQPGKLRAGMRALLQDAKKYLPGYEDLHQALACNNIKRARELLDALRAVGSGTALYLPKERNGVPAPQLVTTRSKLLARLTQARIAYGLYLRLQSQG